MDDFIQYECLCFEALWHFSFMWTLYPVSGLCCHGELVMAISVVGDSCCLGC